jgi:ankyrin repeat protein
MSLFDACERAHTPAAIDLIERGASVNEKNQNRETPLHYACYYGHTATAVALIVRGANVNEKNQFGETPMHVYLVILPRR